MDEGSTEATALEVAVPRRTWWALVAMLAAAAMDLIDTTIVNVAVPTIRVDLAASAAQIEWVVAGYALAFGVGLITGARLGDRFGRREAFLVGVAVFTAASLASGLAPTATVLIAARVVQGVAAAVMIPQILTVIQVSIPAAARSKAYAAFGATAAIGTVSGPLLGGLLVQADLFGASWRPIFLINVPIGLVTLAVTACLLPDSRAELAQRLDLVGVALLALGLLGVLYPLVEGPQLGWPGWLLVVLMAGVLILAGFVAWQHRRQATAAPGLVALRLFADRGFTGGVAAQLALYAAVTGFFLVMAITLQTGLGFTALRTGLVFAAWSVGVAAASGPAGALAPSLGRRLTATGTLVMALGMAALLAAVYLAGPSSAWAFVPGLLVAGLGMGLVAPTLVDVALVDVPAEDAGSASGLVATSGQLGGALGVALIAAIYFATLGGAPPSAAGSLRALAAALYYEITVLLGATLLMMLLPPARPAKS